jgi:hypothetical protein
VSNENYNADCGLAFIVDTTSTNISASTYSWRGNLLVIDVATWTKQGLAKLFQIAFTTTIGGNTYSSKAIIQLVDDVCGTYIQDYGILQNKH